MRDNTARQTAAMKARVRRLRSQYRKRTAIIGVLLFLIGLVAGIFGYRWYTSNNPDLAEQPAPEEAVVTPSPMPTDDGAAEQAFPEVEQDPEVAEQAGNFFELETEAEAEVTPEPVAEAPAGEPTVAPTPEPTSVPDMASDAVEEFDPTQGEIPEEYLTVEDENGESEIAASAAEETPAEETPVEEVPAEETPAEETPVEEIPAEETSVEETPVEEIPAEETPVEATTVDETPAGETPVEETPAGEAPAEEAPAEATTVDETPAEETPAVPDTATYGPQVIAIVPYGESFTYSTQITADGNARVEVTDEPYETVSFTQTIRNFMRPTDFADKYSTQYKLQGNEAGVGFELILNDYTGEAVIVPQNVIDVSLCSESGNAVERGYQLMDAEIGGNYGVALTTNTPKVLYKRYKYAAEQEEMAYLVVTTYNDGVTSQILFQLESDEPEPEPEVVYTILQRGLTGDEVVNLQRRLIELGYLSGEPDGSFGAYTEDAIKRAQGAFGMAQTGVADSAFQQRLFEGAETSEAGEASQDGGYVTLNGQSTGEKVVNLQLRLRELGYYDGKADGGYGPKTESAVKRAQDAFGMEQTGIADEAFQQRLFAGAEAADDAVAEVSTVG